MSMRNLLFGSVASAAFLASPAAKADVNVFAEIFKDVDIVVLENIDIAKDVLVDVEVNVQAEKAAEADSIVNQSNFSNEACENCAEKFDYIVGSVTGNEGIVSVNQATGNMNNQGNAVTIAVDDVEVPPTVPDPEEPVGDPAGFANAQSSASQFNAGNFVDTINIVFREARILDSINDNAGVIHVNQSAGNINNQTNVFTAALALSTGVALSETDLGQVNGPNFVHEADVLKTALIENSINNNSGAVGVNQTSGNLANQANVMTFGAAIALQGGGGNGGNGG